MSDDTDEDDDEVFNPDDYPINRGTPAHDLDGYEADDPKRVTLDG